MTDAPTAKRRRTGLPLPTDRSFLDAPCGRTERWVLIALFLALLVLRIVWIQRQGFDSDEAQHLHVAWAWTQGEVQYRDVFDNHTPLFHLLMAPFVAVVGERANVLTLARFAMLPLFLGILWITWSLGGLLFGRRVGAWAAIWLGYEKHFFHKSLEFRTDDLWAFLWILGVLVLVRGRASRRRVFLAGLVMGAAICVSLKTLLLLGCLGLAVLALPLLPAALGGKPSWRRIGRGALVLGSGALVVPVLIFATMGILGAWPRMVECVWTHNLLPDPVHQGGPSWLGFLGSTALFLGILLVPLRLGVAPGDRKRQWVVVVASVLVVLAEVTLWPLPRRQDVLPVYPVLALGLVALVFHGGLALEQVLAKARKGLPAGPRPYAWGAATMLVLFAGYFFLIRLPIPGRPYSTSTRDAAAIVGETLRLTDPGDTVMDAKGEAVYRNRPYYYVLESFTRESLRRGLLPDTIPEAMVRAGTCVALRSLHLFPPRARAFIEAHYVPVGELRVAGSLLGPGGTTNGAWRFETVIGTRYAIVTGRGRAGGTLDGAPYRGPVALAPGWHTFVPSDEQTPVAVLWAKAAERGFTPFAREPVSR